MLQKTATILYITTPSQRFHYPPVNRGREKKHNDLSVTGNRAWVSFFSYSTDEKMVHWLATLPYTPVRIARCSAKDAPLMTLLREGEFALRRITKFLDSADHGELPIWKLFRDFGCVGEYL